MMRQLKIPLFFLYQHLHAMRLFFTRSDSLVYLTSCSLRVHVLSRQTRLWLYTLSGRKMRSWLETNDCHAEGAIWRSSPLSRHMGNLYIGSMALGVVQVISGHSLFQVL